jgi:hypothetical protein
LVFLIFAATEAILFTSDLTMDLFHEWKKRALVRTSVKKVRTTGEIEMAVFFWKVVKPWFKKHWGVLVGDIFLSLGFVVLAVYFGEVGLLVVILVFLVFAATEEAFGFR